jgi:hypothetical protein
MAFSNIIDSSAYRLLEDVTLYDFEEYNLSHVDNFYGIANLISERVRFKSDYGEEFSTPENTWDRGYGDCEDFCFLFANLAYLRFGIKMNLIIMNTDEYFKTVENGGIGNHIVLEYDGKFYSGQYGCETTVVNVLYSFTFDEVFY